MAFKTASWNIEKPGFGDGRKTEAIVEQVKWIDPDIMVFPEAFAEDQQEGESVIEAVAKFKALGYVVEYGSYKDLNDRPDRHGLLVINRLGNTALTFVGERRVGKSLVVDPDTKIMVDVYGLHLDDRSEERRIEAIREVEIGDLTVVQGDLNSMVRRGIAPHLLGARAAGLVARTLPLARSRSIFTRLNRMADGSVSRYLEINGMHNANVGNQSTWPSILPLCALDQIWVGDKLWHKGFEVGSWHQAGISDHRSVSATILT